MKLGDLKGVGPKLLFFAQLLWNFSVQDALMHLPRRYEDRRKPLLFEELDKRVGQVGLSYGTIERYIPRFGSGRKWLEAVIQVPSSSPTPSYLYLVWFHSFGNSIQKGYPVGTQIFFTGKIDNYRGRLQITHPEMSKESGASLGLGKWVPVYPKIEGLTARKFREIISVLLEKGFDDVKDLVPPTVQKEFSLESLHKSLFEIHVPTEWDPQIALGPLFANAPKNKFFNRLVFDEFFVFSLALEKYKNSLVALAVKCEVPKIQKFKALEYPFELTNDQKKALSEIENDLVEKVSSQNKVAPMHRLVQGDVGSGKTIVAFAAMIQTVQSGYQTALMAPTQILCEQHYLTFKKFFPIEAKLSVQLSGALKDKEKKDLRTRIASGEVKYVFGTQAILSALTQFKNLGLVVFDEQHRFGVEQRRELQERNHLKPHLLVMTATPIPRSLALTLYGDLDISVIKEKPVGRKEVKTFIIKQSHNEKLSKRLFELVNEGRQIFLVYPRIESSDEDELSEEDITNVTQAFEYWKNLFGDKVALLHGKMKAALKDQVMADFRAKKYSALVSTTVIEVGIDIPNASVMVIVSAESFGLSQLHQLRGRVGRGELEGICALVVADTLEPETEARLQVIVESTDGFAIAERDMLLRGPGDFMGQRQSGASGFKTAHLLRDISILELAKKAAHKVLELDPDLRGKEHAEIAKVLAERAEAATLARSG